MALLTTMRRRIVAAACAAASLPVCGAAIAQTPAENDVRAAFLYNFTKFVEWPSTPGAKPTEPFRMCVVADAGFTRVVDTIVQGESVLGRPLVVVTPATAEAARTCQLLYVAQAERERGGRLLAAVRDQPVLTVGDSPRFLESGGTIQFVLDNRRVRFDVNLQAAERSGLHVSSSLLRVARHITPSRTGP